MGGAHYRMKALAYQLEQAYAEGILTQPLIKHILDQLQDYIEGFIQQEQQQQLQQWYTGTDTRGGSLDIIAECLDLGFAEPESEEEVIYREYIKSLPEGL